MHTEHTHVKLIGAVKSTFSHQAVCNRCLYFLYKLHQFFGSPGCHGTAADKNKWLFTLIDQLCCLCQIFFFDILCAAFYRKRLFFYILGLCGGHIFCDINQNRTRSAFLCNAERLTDRICQFCDVFYNIVMLCDRHRYTCDVDLLETVSSKQRNGYVRCDGNHWNGIHICRCNTGYQIRGSGTRSCHTYADFSGCSCISVCRMSSTLLMGC